MGLTGRKTCKEGHLMDSSWRYCPVCLAPTTGWLVAFKNKRVSKVYTIHEGKSKVGSGADCEIRIMLDGISRNHIMLKAIGDDYTVVDLGSELGLMVNYQKVTSARVIDGDIITLGDNDFKFKSI